MKRTFSRRRTAALVLFALLLLALVPLLSLGQAPTAPTTLFIHSTDAQAGNASPASGIDLTPVFSATFNDLDLGALAKKIKIQVSSDQTFAVVSHWNSGQITIADVANGARCQNVDYNGQALSGLTTYFWRCKFWDETDAAGAWSAAATFTTGPAPYSPSNMFVDSTDASAQTSGNPVTEIDQSPIFTALFTHQSSGSVAQIAKIQVSTDPSFATVTHWNSGQVTIANTAHNTRTPNIAYSGQYLQGDTVFYWRIRLSDELGNVSAWSTEPASFRTILVPSAPTALQVGSTEAQTGTAGNPVTNIDLTPAFSAVVSHPNPAMPATQIKIQVSTDSTFANVTHWNSGKIAISSTLPAARCQDVAYNGQPLSGQTTYFWRVRFFASDGGVSEWSTVAASFTTQAAPSLATSLFVGSSEAQTGTQGDPVNLIDLNPSFSATYHHQSSVAGTKVKIQVSTDVTFASVTHWTSGQLSIANVASGSRSADVSYNGQLLRGNTRYYWRIRFYDSNDNPGPWSTEAASFITILAPIEPTNLFVGSQNAQSGSSGNPVSGIDLTPIFSARMHHQDPAGLGKKIKIQVTTDSTFNTITHWNSGNISISNVTDGARSQDIAYAGSALANSTTYYWRCRFVDAYPSTGPWSVEAASFATEGAGTPEPATLDTPNLKQGAAYTVTISKTGGTAFASSNTFDLTGGGLTVSSVQALDANSLQVSFTVNELAAAGDRTFEVRSGSNAIASGPAYVFFPSQRVPARRGNVSQEPLLNPALVSAGVVALTGEFLFEAQDLLLPGRMLPLGFGRNYRSFLDYDGTVGQSWSSVIDDQLSYDAGSDTIIYFSADGRLHTLTLAGTGTTGVGPYVETGSYVEWTRGDQGTTNVLDDVYVALGAHGDKATYTASNTDTEGHQVFRLVSMADRFNNTVTLLRDTVGRVTEIRGDLYDQSEPARHRLLLEYHPDGRLKSIEDFADYSSEPADIVGSFTGTRTWNFNYDAQGRLIEVLLPKTKDWFDDEVSSLSAGARMQYDFSDTAHPFLITDVHSPKQVALFQFNGTGLSWLRNQSDSQGRVVSQDIGRSSSNDTTHRHFIVYGSGTCDVVDPLGRRMRCTLTTSGRVQEAASFTGFFSGTLSVISPKLRAADPDSFVSAFEYNSQGEMIRTTMPRGNIAVWFYDDANTSQRAKGNLLRAAKLPGTADMQGLPALPAGQANGILTTFTYTTDFNLLATSVDPRAYDLQANYNVTQGGQLARDDSAQFTTTRIYDTQGRLTRVESATITEAVSPLSPNVGQQVAIEFQYNSFGQVTQQADVSAYPSPEVGSVATYEYGTSGFNRGRLIRTHAAPAGTDFKTEVVYDSLGFPRESVDNAGATSSVLRDQHERVRRTLGPALAHLNGHRYRVDREFDREGNPLRQTIFDPILDAQGNITGAAPREVTTSWVTDIMGNVVQAIDEPTTGQFRTATSVYDSAFQAIEGRTPGGLKSVTQFDERGLAYKTFDGLLASETDLQQAITIHAMSYDANGNATSSIDGRGFVRTAAFDSFDRVVKSSDARQPDPTEALVSYDHAGNTIEVTVNGKKSSTATGTLTRARRNIDNLGRAYRTARLAVKTDGTTALGYANEPGNDEPGWSLETVNFLPDGRLLSSVRDLLDAATPALSTPDVSLGYDDLGRLVRQSDRGSNLATWSFDLAGNAITMDDFRFDQETGQSTHLVRHSTYDELGRVIGEYLDSEQPTVVRYNAAGLRTLTAPPERGKVQNSYDGAWRLVGTTESASGVWSINSSNGSVNQTGSQALNTLYEFDDDDNLIRVIDNGGNQTVRRYDLAGRHVSTTFPDGTNFVIGASASVGSVISGQAYVAATGGYDAEGNVLSVFDEGGNRIARTYDEEGEILTVLVTPATGNATLVGEVSASYEYDGLGRVLSAQNQDWFAHTITRAQTWNSLSKLEAVSIADYQSSVRVNSVNELGFVDSYTSGGATTSFTRDVLDRVLETRVTQNSTVLFAGATLYHGRGPTISALSSSDDTDIVHKRDGRGRVTETVLNTRSTDEPQFSRTFEYCPQCGMLKSSIDNWRTSFTVDDRNLGTRFYQDDMGRETGAAYDATFPISGANRWASASFSSETRASATQFDAMDMPQRRSLFLGTGGFASASKGVVETPHTSAYGTTGSPLALGQGSDFVPDSIGSINIERAVATGPNIVDDGVFTYRYDHRGRLIDTRRKSDGVLIEERRYDALGIEGNRQLVDMEVMEADFSGGDTTHVWYSTDDVDLGNGGLGFVSTTEPNLAVIPFPGDLHQIPNFASPVGARASYHDFLLRRGAATRLCNLYFTGGIFGYSLKVEVDGGEIRLYDRQSESAAYVQFGLASWSGPDALNLGVGIDLGQGLFTEDVKFTLFVDGSPLLNFTRAQGFNRFAPTSVSFEAQGGWGTLHRYHGYLSATATGGAVPVVMGRPEEEFMRRALCLSVPGSTQGPMSQAQQARKTLEEIRNDLAEAINGFALYLGLDEACLSARAQQAQSGCRATGNAAEGDLSDMLALAAQVQSTINRLETADLQKHAAQLQSASLDALQLYMQKPLVNGDNYYSEDVQLTCGVNHVGGPPAFFYPRTLAGDGSGNLRFVGLSNSGSVWTAWYADSTHLWAFEGQIYCDVDTIAGFNWSLRSSRPAKLMTPLESGNYARGKLVDASYGLQLSLDAITKSLPAWQAKAARFKGLAKFFNAQLENPNIAKAVQLANRNKLTEATDFALGVVDVAWDRATSVLSTLALPLKILAMPITVPYQQWERFNMLRAHGIGFGSALFDAGLSTAVEDSGLAGIYAGFTEKDLFKGDQLSTGEAQVRGALGVFQLGLTIFGGAEMVGSFGAETKAARAALREVEVGEYDTLPSSAKLGQRHHLNQNAIYESVIPEGEGAAIRLKGNAFTEARTPHYNAHEYLERWLDYFRRGQPGYGRLPTNRQYGLALEESLVRAGYSRLDAQGIAAIARQQRATAGLLEGDAIPNLSRPIYQKARCATK